MNRILALWFMFACCLLLTSATNAQDTCYVDYDSVGNIKRLDLGVCDTFRIGCTMTISLDTMQAGDSIAIPFYIWNDYELGGFAVGLAENGTGVRFGARWMIAPDSPIPPGSRPFVNTWTSESGDSIQVGWVDFAGFNSIPPTFGSVARLVGYLYLKLQDLVPQTVTIEPIWTVRNHPVGLFSSLYQSPWENYTFRPRFPECSGVTLAAVCGDVNGSQSINIADAVYLVNYIFGTGPAPQDSSNGDVNCDGGTDVADVIFLVSYIFSEGASPCDGC